MRLSRRKYFKALDAAIISHLATLAGRANENLMWQVADWERYFRRQAWPRPHGCAEDMLVNGAQWEIQLAVLYQFPFDAFAGAPEPLNVDDGSGHGAGCKHAHNFAGIARCWDPLGLLRDTELLRARLNRLERKLIGTHSEGCMCRAWPPNGSPTSSPVGADRPASPLTPGIGPCASEPARNAGSLHGGEGAHHRRAPSPGAVLPW